jgi:lipopolysaccharide/colanic/teichoic acid biosynthesis glycosyltransferase
LLKRFFDIFISVLCLIVLLPAMLLICVLILINLGSPIIFLQERPGKDGKIFKMLKFRTMLNNKNKSGDFLPDKQRITKFGKILRNSSLDELPELFNVLKGDMSIVGPRPLLVEYLPLYSENQARRHEVLPGITGWAQINGRNSISWDKKLKLDQWYVDNHNFYLDIKIIYKTFIKVLIKSDIDDGATIGKSKFLGNKK